MELRAIGAVINVVVVSAYAAVAFRTGYRRRREHWTAGSWIGFGLTIAGALALIAFTMIFASGVDNHEPWVGAPRSNTRNVWIVAALASMLGGVGLGAGTMIWFARGRATLPFPFARRRARTPLSSPEAERPTMPVSAGPTP